MQCTTRAIDLIVNESITLAGNTITSWDDVGGGGGTWGTITGTLSTQTDLNSALNNRSCTSHTHAWGTITGTLANQTDLNNALGTKSDTSHSHTTLQGGTTLSCTNSFADSVGSACAACSHADSYGTTCGVGSHADSLGIARGTYSHADSAGTSCGDCSHADSYGIACGSNSHSDSCGIACGDSSHADSCGAACGSVSHSDSCGIACGVSSHADSSGTACGDNSHANSCGVAWGYCSHANSLGTACGRGSHADSSGTACGDNSHANSGGTANSDCSFAAAGGFACQACSVAMGQSSLTYASGMFAFASGTFGYTTGAAQKVCHVLRGSSANSVILTADGLGSTGIIIPTSAILTGILHVSGYGNGTSSFSRRVVVINDGGSHTILQTDVIGTDLVGSGTPTTISITAGLSGISVAVDGSGSSTKWSAVFEGALLNPT